MTFGECMVEIISENIDGKGVLQISFIGIKVGGHILKSLRLNIVNGGIV